MRTRRSEWSIRSEKESEEWLGTGRKKEREREREREGGGGEREGERERGGESESGRERAVYLPPLSEPCPIEHDHTCMTLYNIMHF